jgi:sugar phosphate isomerase/epimerase
MKIGLMDGTILRPTREETLDAVRAHGITHMQINLGQVDMPDVSKWLAPDRCDRIRDAFETRGMTIAAISGHFNMIHPDLQQREAGLRGLRLLASVCERLDTSVVTLCTGTRDTTSIWRRHPDNDLPEAWADLVVSMRQAVQIAKEFDVTLAFEPEVSNTVDSAQKAWRLLDEIGSPHLKVTMDGANIYHHGELPRQREILDQAFELLGPEIALAHAKDIDHDGEAGHLAAGKGLLDYTHYLALLGKHQPDVALILHGLTEAELPESLGFIADKLQIIGR